MKIIAITTPTAMPEDVCLIQSLMDKGIDMLHLRKPNANIDACRKILDALTSEQRSKIIIHDYPELYYNYSLKGIHINKNIPSLPDDYKGFKTRSCHSFDELAKYKNDYDYLFLSPIFDSISKNGYKSAYTDEDLHKASGLGIIDDKVIALGGVTLDKIEYLRKLHFGGVAMIGGIYNMQLLQKLDHLIAYK
ncbi:MAG: thiamine phosphate synthase [Paludibacteraceae bacterium]|nr:thiamine phosphate synthase [Paludibacteraceae bacterium]